MACSPCRLSRPQQTLQTSTDCKANQLIKKKFPYSFIKLKFHSAHLVWLLCAQVAGIDSQPQFESVSLSRTHHPIHIPPSVLPIPDSQFHSQSQTQSQLLAFPGPLACLFVCSCLSSVPCSPAAPRPLISLLSIVSLFWLPYNCFISPSVLWPLSCVLWLSITPPVYLHLYRHQFQHQHRQWRPHRIRECRWNYVACHWNS